MLLLPEESRFRALGCRQVLQANRQAGRELDTPTTAALRFCLLTCNILTTFIPAMVCFIRDMYVVIEVSGFNFPTNAGHILSRRSMGFLHGIDLERH